MAVLLTETQTYLCNIPGAKLWTYSYRRGHGAKGSSQHYRCVILSWALTQGSVQRNCSIQPKSRNKKMFPKTPSKELWETMRVSLWTMRNYFFLQTPSCPYISPITPPEFDQDIHKHLKIPCWVKWKCGGHKKSTKKRPKSTKNTYCKIFCWLLNVSTHPPWTHNCEKNAEDIITLI